MVSRCNLVEGHERKFDLSILRAFGTKCFFMLTLQMKGGLKRAMGPKAQLGAIIGIEDNMPAYRVYDFNPRGKIRKIPFAHEGHFPFRDYANWSEEEKNLPDSFLPSLEAKADPTEWERYGFGPKELSEFNSGHDENVSVSLPASGVFHSSATLSPIPLGGGGGGEGGRDSLRVPGTD